MEGCRKGVEVVDYDPRWPDQFEEEAQAISEALGETCLAVHHVGSTSVSGFAAKPKIDILAVVKKPSAAIVHLEAIGFEYKGEYNIPMHYGFSKRGQVKVNLHVYAEGHPEVELNLTFRDTLRRRPDLRDQYAELKRALLEEESTHQKAEGALFRGYTLEKSAFIRQVLREAGFCRLRFLHCSDAEEWAAARAFRQRYFFDRVPIEDPYQWTFSHPDHVHFILYRGVEMVGYAHIQLWKDMRAAVRIIVVEEERRRSGYGRCFLEGIEAWLQKEDRSSVHAEVSPNAIAFYRSLEYVEMPFADPDGYVGDPSDLPIGKLLVHA